MTYPARGKIQSEQRRLSGVILNQQNYILAFCFYLLIMGGCSVTQKIIPRMVFSSPEEALKYIAAKGPADVTLQALANIQVANQNGRYPMKLAILLKRPTGLRVEAIPVLGPPTFFLSIHGQTLKVFLTESRTFYISHATSENIARYLPLRMDPEDMLAVLTGTSPLINTQDRVIKGRQERDHYRIDMEGSAKRLSLWIRLADGFFDRLDVYKQQDILYQAFFEEPIVVDGFVIPQKINILSEGGEKASFSIRYAEIQFLKTSDPIVFDLNVPPGITPIYLD